MALEPPDGCDMDPEPFEVVHPFPIKSHGIVDYGNISRRCPVVCLMKLNRAWNAETSIGCERVAARQGHVDGVVRPDP